MNEIYCGSMNIEDFVTQGSTLEEYVALQMERIIKDISQRKISGPETRLVGNYQQSIKNHRYKILDLEVFALPQKYGDAFLSSVPKFIAVPSYTNTFRLDIKYSSKIFKHPVDIDSNTSGKIRNRLSGCFPIIQDYYTSGGIDASRIKKSHEEVSDIRKKISQGLKKAHNSNVKEFGLLYKTDFVLPPTIFQQLEDAKTILSESEYFFMIEAKPQFWNSDDSDTPENIMLIALPSGQNYSDDYQCRIISAFNPLNIKGENNG